MQYSVSFAKDLAPIFRQFRGSMTWRFDLTKYEDVKANAASIWAQFSTSQMPPPPYPPLSPQQLAMFKAWMDEGFPA
jgi:hypothetical protein